MTIRFTCAECASVMKIKDELAGTSARCPKCKAKFVVPAPSHEPTTAHQTALEKQPAHSTRFEDDPEDRSDVIKNPSSTHDDTDDSSDNLTPPTIQQRASNPHPVASYSPPVESKSTQSNSDDFFHLQLDDSDAEIPVPTAPIERIPIAAAPVAPIVAAPTVAEASLEEVPVEERDYQVVVQEEDDELDCPSMFLSKFMNQMSSEVETIEPKKVISTRATSDFSANSTKAPAPTRRDDRVDPMKFLMDNPPPKSPPPSFAEPSFSPPAYSPPSYSEPDSDADFGAASDSNYEIPSSPTPQPISRRTPVAPSSRPTPEKIDLATAAKMMKKAIKDSQADASRQRAIDARPGFDYTLFFREFGLRGLAILLAAIIGPAFLYYSFDFMLSSKLKLPKLGQVSGTVKLDGKPLSGAMVFFAPVDAAIEGGKKERARTSVGVSNESGFFKLIYAPGIEGVAAGKCLVWLSHSGEKGVVIPIDWVEQSKRLVEVSVGTQKAPFDINLDSPKKK